MEGPSKHSSSQYTPKVWVRKEPPGTGSSISQATEGFFFFLPHMSLFETHYVGTTIAPMHQIVAPQAPFWKVAPVHPSLTGLFRWMKSVETRTS